MALPLHILSKEYDPSLAETASSINESISTPRHIPEVAKPTRTFTSHRPSGDAAYETSSDEDDDDGTETPRPGSSSSSSALGDDYTIDEQIYVDVSSVPSYFPTHPLQEMQAPFEESMLDAGREESPLNYRETDPEKFSSATPARRSLILSPHGAYDNISYSARWRATPDAKHHPIVKIMSQVVFGVHLLCQAMEQSVPEVAGILRGFVQELDGFLRRVDADMDLAIKDVTDLHKNLSLPLQHVNVFDQLLDDRKYRSQTLEGNIRIDAIIKKYSLLTEDYVADLKALAESNLLFGAYLARIGDGWTRGSRELADVNAAMVGNAAIWDASTKMLGEKSKRVRSSLQKCALCVFEFEKRCAAAARRSMSASRSSSRLSNSRSFTKGEKPLPAVPSIPELPTPTPAPAPSAAPSPKPMAPPQRTHRRTSSNNSMRNATPTSARSGPPSAGPSPLRISETAPVSPTTSSRPSFERSRLARSAGLASRSMQDLRAAGFVGSTTDLAAFLRTTAPGPSNITTITAMNAPQPKKSVAPKKKSLSSFFQAFRRKKSDGQFQDVHPLSEIAYSDPFRPRTAPTSPSSASPRPAHVPIAAFMGGVGQGPTGMGMSMGLSLSMSTPATPRSAVSSELGEKGRVRFDSLVGSGRQSRQSGRQSRGSGRASRASAKSATFPGSSLGRTRTDSNGGHSGIGVGRLKLVFLERFRF